MSSLPPVVTSLEELESTLGVLFVGFLVCIILYGFTFFRPCLSWVKSNGRLTFGVQKLIFISLDSPKIMFGLS